MYDDMPEEKMSSFTACSKMDTIAIIRRPAL
jgi:hypothetical protein